jgi:superfamily II DNA helicase RecQ
VLKGSRSVALRAWREGKRSARRAKAAAGAADLPAEAQELFERLRAWRLEAARRHGVPAYVIFHDATLREIARVRPSSLEMLRGEATDKVKDRGHDTLSTFGIGRDRSDREWRAIARQCVALGLLEIDHDAYGALRLTAESRPVLRGERAVSLRAWREGKRSARRVKAPAMDLSAEGEALFERLRAWRLEAARRHGVPAYVIFHDATLREIAHARPSSLEGLRGISGVGARKLEAYGAEIIGLLAP